MNFTNRKNFIKLIDDITNNKIETIIVENKDRLARFGIEYKVKSFGTYKTIEEAIKALVKIKKELDL